MFDDSGQKNYPNHRTQLLFWNGTPGLILCLLLILVYLLPVFADRAKVKRR